MAGAGGKDCVATLVESKKGPVLIGKLADRPAASLSRRAVSLMRGHGARFETVKADKGTESPIWRSDDLRPLS